MRRALAALILALSTIVPITPASAVSPITFADIYNPAKIIRVDFTLPQSSVDSLNTQATLENYVPGQVAFSLDKKASGPLDIKLRLKGSTSLQKLDWSPSFKIKFPAGPAGLRWLGPMASCGWRQTPQMSRAYSPMVRSEENQPTLAMFRMALARQPAWSSQRRSTPRCAA